VRFLVTGGALLAAAAVAQAQTKLSPPSKMALVQAQCAGHCTCGADADCGAAGTCTGGLCTAGDGARVACNADTDCAAGRTCPPVYGPCSPAFRVTSGTLTLRGAKEPAPTRDPKQNNPGEVRLVGVTKGAAPFTGTLDADVVLKTTFGTDANGNCALNASQLVVDRALSATLACKGGKCKGRLVQFARLPKPCADVSIVSELVSATVRDDTGVPLATVGLAIPAGKADAP